MFNLTDLINEITKKYDNKNLSTILMQEFIITEEKFNKKMYK